MLGLLIWAVTFVVYCTIYLLALAVVAVVGIVIEICDTLREGWSRKNSEI